MGIAADGMKITEYMENGRQEYLWLHYKAADSLPDEKYHEVFESLRACNVIISDCYEDVEWVLKGSDGRKFHVRFDIDNSDLWNERLKHYALLKLEVQKADIHSTSVNIKRIKMELFETDYLNPDCLHTYRERIGAYGRSRRLYLAAFGEFLSFIRGEDTEGYLEAINSLPYLYTAKPRNLPCYHSILLFDSVIDDFISRTGVEERARYYPVLIWWKISSVIPLRPGEVYQLPKDCICEKNGKYYIHIERVKKQFQREKYTSPVIKDFEIRQDIYQLIRDYIDYVDKIPDTDGTGYLFSIRVLKETAGLKSKDKDVERLTHITMQTIYKHFQKEIIEQEYGCHMVPLGQRKDENDIEEIKMGDVRHLAIINLMMMGDNPLYIMELAGHHKLNTQMGYYNHVDTFATAKSHVLKEMMKKAESNLNFSDYGSGDYVLQKNLLGASYYDLPLVFDGKGRCRSRNFPYECVCTECIFCPHFIPDRNLSAEYYDALKEENDKNLEALQMELNLLLSDLADGRDYERVGKEIGVTLNRKILIDAYKRLQEGK